MKHALSRVINEYKSDLLPEGPKNAYSAYSPELGLANAQFKELLDGLPAGFALIFQGLLGLEEDETPLSISAERELLVRQVMEVSR